MDIRVIEPWAGSGTWVIAIVDGYWFEAKVYAEPSEFGINLGRVSKLVVSSTDQYDSGAEFFEQQCYVYERGVILDHAPPGLVDKIVAWCESLEV